MLNDTIYVGDIASDICQDTNYKRNLPCKEYDTIEIMVSENKAKYYMNDATKVTIFIFPIIEKMKNKESKFQIAIAAKDLLSDYEQDEELTIFTRLDTADFYE
jgi:hypothetical protein